MLAPLAIVFVIPVMVGFSWCRVSMPTAMVHTSDVFPFHLSTSLLSTRPTRRRLVGPRLMTVHALPTMPDTEPDVRSCRCVPRVIRPITSNDGPDTFQQLA